MAPTYAGDFHLRGKDLRALGLNRVGNMLVPNSNYCAFEDWIMPILDAMLLEQKQGTLWTPSKVTHCATNTAVPVALTGAGSKNLSRAGMSHLSVWNLPKVTVDCMQHESLPIAVF